MTVRELIAFLTDPDNLIDLDSEVRIETDSSYPVRVVHWGEVSTALRPIYQDEKGYSP